VERAAVCGRHSRLDPQVRRTFDSYWADPAFVPYDPDEAGDAERFRAALGSDRGAGAITAVSGLEVRPFPHQTEILEALESERAMHDRHRNLVVAATGTGKTVAALDYVGLRGSLPRDRLLFVAHRREILEQSLRTYREVLADGAFGDMYVGGERSDR
jgi:hypothetical protein